MPERLPAGPITVELPPALLDVLVERVTEELGARQPVAEGWVDVATAAEHLACSKQRIYDLVCRKDTSRIPHRKEGSRLLFKLSKLDEWVERGHAA